MPDSQGRNRLVVTRTDDGLDVRFEDAPGASTGTEDADAATLLAAIEALIAAGDDLGSPSSTSNMQQTWLDAVEDARAAALAAARPVEDAPREPSDINSWQDWPDDVRPLLEAWNRGTLDRPVRLSFRRTRTFACTDCGEHYRGHQSGAAEWLCDGCLIDRTRDVLAGAARPVTGTEEEPDA